MTFSDEGKKKTIKEVLKLQQRRNPGAGEQQRVL